jgi:hypothetical protein
LMFPSYFFMISAARWSDPGASGICAMKENLFKDIPRMCCF